MIDKILVALDGSELSEEVLPLATLIARKAGASIELLCAVNEGQFREAIGQASNDHLLLVLEEASAAAKTYLQDMAKRLEAQGVVATTEVAIGEPARSIVGRVRDTGASLAAMTTHGHSGLARWTLGSTTEKVLRKGTVPLMVYRAEGKPTAGILRSVLLPLDGSEASQRAMPYATFFAKTLGVPLTIARSAHVPVYAFGDESVDQMPEVMEAIEQDAKQYLEETGAKLRQQGVQVETRFLRGEPASQLIELAHHLPDSIVVMSTAGRTGIGRMVLGSVADRVVRHSQRPVVLIRVND